jgi:uncharacterized protein GlcG (DUF336 family)
VIAAAALVLALGTSPADAQAPPPYGPAITLEQAKKAMAAAEAEARKNNWNVVISIIDSAARLVMLQRLDNTQYGSIDVATGKATTAVNFKRPSKALEDAITGGGAGLRILSIQGLSPLEGGIPIVVDGKIIGGIGVSGVTSQQDAQVAKAGADALK